MGALVHLRQAIPFLIQLYVETIPAALCVGRNVNRNRYIIAVLQE